MSEEEIAARHFVTPAVVKQRLRLASVSPKLHEVYADDGMTLEQLMAFSVTADQARQEQVWDNVSRSRLDEPYQIRRMLTENTVRASDRRAQFIGLDAYEQAGGAVMRDLFEHDDGGWLRDVPLLDRRASPRTRTARPTLRPWIRVRPQRASARRSMPPPVMIERTAVLAFVIHILCWWKRQEARQV
jgi:ParB family chromosome partitioning protein